MTFTLPPLPYAQNALEPHISAETLEYHYDRHHRAYVNNLNKLTEGSDLQKWSLEELIKREKGGIFNNAAQVYNHTFYWHSMTPKGGGPAGGKVADLIKRDFHGFEQFRDQFSAVAAGVFGSGWAWLIQDNDGKLVIEGTSNADCPIRVGKNPLLTCDVWEHAYYIDYRNARANYIEAFWKVVNWEFVNSNLM